MPGPLKSPDMARRAVQRQPHLKVLFTSGYTQNAIVHTGRLDEGVELLRRRVWLRGIFPVSNEGLSWAAPWAPGFTGGTKMVSEAWPWTLMTAYGLGLEGRKRSSHRVSCRSRRCAWRSAVDDTYRLLSDDLLRTLSDCLATLPGNARSPWRPWKPPASSVDHPQLASDALLVATGRRCDQPLRCGDFENRRSHPCPLTTA